jgi:hypothetical protein
LDDLAVDWGCMEYPRILNLIDGYLDRLTEARQVLLALDSESGNGQKRGSQTAAKKRALKAAARESQSPLAFEIPPFPPEPPRQEPKSTTNKRTGLRVAKASAESHAALFVQNELFPQEQPSEPSREKLTTDAKKEKLLPATEPVPVSVKVRAQRKPTTRNKVANTPAPRALGGMVSAAPVFIPAERVRQEYSQKATNRGEASESATAAPLTVEMLTQRWVQGLTS